MKTPIYVIVLLAFVLSGCSKDVIDNPISNNDITTIDLKYAQADVQSKGVSQGLNIPMDETACFRTQMLDAKLEAMGYVDFSFVDNKVVITFKTENNWNIKETYLDVISCTSELFPLDAHGNPILSAFKYKTTHKNGIKRVDHVINDNDVTSSLCFAAYAIIEDKLGRSKEVWAHGWEMYTPAYQKGCLPDDIEDIVGEEECVLLSGVEFFVPLKSSTSGVYPLAGSSPDSVTLRNTNPTSEGFVDIDLNFIGIPNNFKNAVLSISFHDLDLYTDIITVGDKTISFAESFTLRNANNEILAVLDGSHTEDGEFVWTFDLPDNIFNGSNLTLHTTFTANLELLEGNEIQVTNTAEELFEVSICGNMVTGGSLQ